MKLEELIELFENPEAMALEIDSLKDFLNSMDSSFDQEHLENLGLIEILRFMKPEARAKLISLYKNKNES